MRHAFRPTGVGLYFDFFLPGGREALRLTGVWDACAARGKAGPVRGLRPAAFLMPNSALRVWAAIGDAVAGRKDTDISR